mgnify:CR=1 FL=1
MFLHDVIRRQLNRGMHIVRQKFIAIHTYISKEHKKQVLAAPFEEDKITDIE